MVELEQTPAWFQSVDPRQSVWSGSDPDQSPAGRN